MRLFLLILLLASIAQALPVAYLAEKVSATHLQNGSLYAPVSKTGYIEVDASNNRDVLQYLRINLSNSNGTNLQSLAAYRDVAASPTEGQKTRMYVDTAEDAQDLRYKIYDTENNTPVVSLRMGGWSEWTSTGLDKCGNAKCLNEPLNKAPLYPANVVDIVEVEKF